MSTRASHQLRIAAVTWIAVGVSACATLGSKPYDAPQLVAPIAKPILWDATMAVVEAEGWQILARDESAGLIEALAPEPAVGAPARERWLFQISNYQLRISRRLEVMFSEREGWVSSGVVCEGYAYLRETQVLAQVKTRVASSLVAARSQLAQAGGGAGL